MSSLKKEGRQKGEYRLGRNDVLFEAYTQFVTRSSNGKTLAYFEDEHQREPTQFSSWLFTGYCKTLHQTPIALLTNFENYILGVLIKSYGNLSV